MAMMFTLAGQVRDRTDISEIPSGWSRARQEAQHWKGTGSIFINGWVKTRNLNGESTG